MNRAPRFTAALAMAIQHPISRSVKLESNRAAQAAAPDCSLGLRLPITQVGGWMIEARGVGFELRGTVGDFEPGCLAADKDMTVQGMFDVPG